MSFLSLFGFSKPDPKPRAPLLLHNTMSRSLETFSPLRESSVSMYNCGPTVYDEQHIGNLRPFVVADVLRRTLRLHGYRVKQVINITDVGHLLGDNAGDSSTGEDRMEVGARKRGLRAQDVAREVTAAFQKDLERVGIDLSAIAFPRATEYIAEQIALIETLEEKGYTYRTDDGIYFDTKKFKEYGKLGNIALEGLQEGARIGTVAGRRNLSDFALWKFSDPSAKRQQEWPSPWGTGFPGWHIECTAMIFSLLGRQIDIHTGGIEHIPVHHNNEIAEAEAVTGKRFARYWLHHQHLMIDGRKISKSLGNTIYLRNIIDRGFSPIAYRYLLLTSHYRSPANFTWEALEAAQTALMKLYRFFHEELPLHGNGIDEPFAERFSEALSRDLDTPRAIALLWEFVHTEKVPKATKRSTLLFANRLLGLGLSREGDLTQKVKVLERDALPEVIQSLINTREDARKAKNWPEADRLRQELRQQGYEIEDKEEGPRVRKVS